MKMLIIEDEKALATSIAEYLLQQQYTVEIAYNLADGLYKIGSYQYDCIILDLGLPDGSGIEILREIKKMQKEDGVIIISANNSIDQKIQGLEIGADDYLSKPFHLSELGARLFSIIRRKNFNNQSIIRQGNLAVDIQSRSVKINDVEIGLTKKEFDLLVFFMGNKNRVVSKSAIAEHLSGDLADMLDNHDFIYAHIKNLKKKLGDDCSNYLKTNYGNGYKWEI